MRHQLSKQLWVTLLFFFVTSSFLYSQAVTSVSAQITGTSLQIIYQMGGLQNGQKFRVRLYSSLDNYTDPIIDGVDGAVGDDLSLAFQNIVSIADPIETLGFITSDLSFKVIATMTYNPISLRSPTEFFKIKRGKDMEITWSGGLAGERITFNLFRNGNLISKDVHAASNQLSTTFKVPKLEKGEGYHMEMTFESEPRPIVLPGFQVKAKSGWIALLVIGGLGYVGYDYSQEGFIYELINGKPEVVPDPLPSPPEGTPGMAIFNQRNN